MNDTIRYIGNKLGIIISEDAEESFDNLNTLPQEIIQQARDLNDKLFARKLIKFYTSEINHDYIAPFVDEVVFGEVPQEVWGEKKYLFPMNMGLISLLVNPKEKNLEALGGGFDGIIVPEYYWWEQGEISVGCPVIIQVNKDYTAKPPVNSCFINAKVRLLNNDEKGIAYVRWIAQKIASYLNKRNLINSFRNPEILNEIAPYNSWTEDAKKAFQGLLREREEIGWKDGEIPGYVGPDGFYN